MPTLVDYEGLREFLKDTKAPGALYRSKIWLKRYSYRGAIRYAQEIIDSVDRWLYNVADMYNLDITVRTDLENYKIFAYYNGVLVFALGVYPKTRVIYIKKLVYPLFVVCQIFGGKQERPTPSATSEERR